VPNPNVKIISLPPGYKPLLSTSAFGLVKSYFKTHLLGL
jgi:hypothetical protein